MPPRSPTLFHTFDPTPALEHDANNFSPLNHEATNDPLNGLRSKEVHFQDKPVTITSRHSIATTTVPLLPSIPSASRLPRQSFAVAPASQGIDITAYIENCRHLNQQLRQAHETERKSWDIERSALLAKIADLEVRLNRSQDTQSRVSTGSAATSAHPFRSDYRITYEANRKNGLRKTGSESQASAPPPVWKGPESTPPATRVFSHDDSDVSHLPSISEDGESLPTLSKEISPTTRDGAQSIDISVVDSSLDGVALKSRGPATTSSFVAKVTSPQLGSPSHNLSPRPQDGSPSSTTVGPPPNNFSLDTNTLLDPLDEKLKRNAGHTPMAIGPGSASLSEVPTELATPKERQTLIPKQDNPPEPAPTKRPPLRPSEDSDTYFSFADGAPTRNAREQPVIDEEPEAEPTFDPQDDPALQGPLMLDSSARSHAATSFLDQVDAKLSEVAANSRLRSDSVPTNEIAHAQTDELKQGSQDDGINESHVKNKSSMEDMPRLKIRNSTNFGSAWGGDMPGRV